MRGVLVAIFMCSAISIACAETKTASINPAEITASKPHSNPLVVHGRPRRLSGTLSIGDSKFEFASGGSGWSIPYGSYPITPSDVGDWGKRHHAIGLNENTIPDPQLNRDREGIEIHASDRLSSAGCVVVEPNVFDKLSHMIFDLIKNSGQAFLHVGPTGAAITATKESPLPEYVYLPEKVSDGNDDRPHHARRTNHHHHVESIHRHRRHHS